MGHESSVVWLRLLSQAPVATATLAAWRSGSSSEQGKWPGVRVANDPHQVRPVTSPQLPPDHEATIVHRSFPDFQQRSDFLACSPGENKIKNLALARRKRSNVTRQLSALLLGDRANCRAHWLSRPQNCCGQRSLPGKSETQTQPMTRKFMNVATIIKPRAIVAAIAAQPTIIQPMP